MKRSRLPIEIAIVLAVKFALLFAIWALWFAHPIERDLDPRAVAAAIVHAAPARAQRAEGRHDAGP